jgi:hypothetical protein
MTMLRMTPFRCRFCRHRFFKRLPPGAEGLAIPDGTESDRRD